MVAQRSDRRIPYVLAKHALYRVPFWFGIQLFFWRLSCN